MKLLYKLSKIFLLLLVLQSVTLAQPKKAQEVFPKDYVKQWNSPNNQKKTKTLQDDKSSNLKTADNKKTKKNYETINEPDALITDEKNVIDVTSLGAAIWIGDKVHAKLNLESLAELATYMKMPLSTVFLVGPHKDLFDLTSYLVNISFDKDVAKQAESARILMAQRYMANLPEELSHIKISPTWIIDTKLGLIVLEGTSFPLKSYFNSQGKFKLGKFKIDQNRATP
jgi:hypothetical protein